MIELQPEYLNQVAHQLIVISSLLSGFSIAVMANLLIAKSQSKVSNSILKVTTVAAACFLITVFAMTKIVMMTTEGYPLKFENSDLDFPKIAGFAAFLLGITTLSVLIALSGWTKSKSTGIFTTIVGILTFIMILLNLQ
jgi:cytochrome bd-type quinol oxidase subunit 2